MVLKFYRLPSSKDTIHIMKIFLYFLQNDVLTMLPYKQVIKMPRFQSYKFFQFCCWWWWWLWREIQFWLKKDHKIGCFDQENTFHLLYSVVPRASFPKTHDTIRKTQQLKVGCNKNDVKYMFELMTAWKNYRFLWTVCKVTFLIRLAWD